MNIYNCFLFPKRYNLVFYQSVCCKEYLKKNNYIMPNSICCINVSKFNGKNIIFFPDINKIFEINNNTIIYELNNISDYKINEYVPDNISYIQNNFFIYQISNKLYIKYLNKNKMLISKGIITLEKEKNYKKIFSGKKNILFCVERTSVNSDNLNDKLNDPFLIDTNIFLSANFKNIEILKCSENLTNAKIISTIYDIDFIQKINNNLVLYVKRKSLYFIDGEGTQIKEMYLPQEINENQICIYKENFLIIEFNKGAIWLYDLIEFKMIYSDKFENLYLNNYSKIENEDIVDENSNIKSLYIKSKLLLNYSKIFIGNCSSNNQGCFFQYNNDLLYLTNIEKKDNIIINYLGLNTKNLKELISLKNENMFVLVKKNNYEFYKFNFEQLNF